MVGLQQCPGNCPCWHVTAKHMTLVLPSSRVPCHITKVPRHSGTIQLMLSVMETCSNMIQQCYVMHTKGVMEANCSSFSSLTLHPVSLSFLPPPSLPPSSQLPFLHHYQASCLPPTHLSFSSPIPHTRIRLIGCTLMGALVSGSSHLKSIPWIWRNTARPCTRERVTLSHCRSCSSHSST